MLVIDNVPTGLAIGTGGRVGRVMSGRILDGGSRKAFAASDTVWLNSSSKVYHCEGTRWYGKTKRGRYLKETEAVSNGYRPARGVRCSNAGRAAVGQPTTT